ncbi:protein cab-1 isoform X2 [Zerene cesonia]|uniref:protein cab-1 isoform X2 n=1 Tax=Zerene cesonia TaxID=33412 RepID=UPI0018E59107|nr:protein cab-1 isoform X2 [Zerene cesonia]
MFAIAVPFAIVLVCAAARQPEALSPAGAYSASKDAVDPELYRDVIVSPFEPHYVQYDDSPRMYSITREDLMNFPRPITPEDLLGKEIAVLRRWEGMENQDPARQDPYSVILDYNQDQPSILLARLLGLGADYRKFSQLPPNLRSFNNFNQNRDIEFEDRLESQVRKTEEEKKTKEEIELETLEKQEKRKKFALTPLDEGYYDTEQTETNTPSNVMEPRKTRQNPNWSRSKTLIADNLDELRLGVTDGATGSTVKPHHIHIIETVNPKPVESIYSNALLAAIGAAVSMALVGLVFGWYTIIYLPSLSKKAKAAADVDYPAYGVTGPTVDPSGDRKLAHSAHMYHYQHQKQQILAMERSCLGRNGSISDPESEDENEEGDYTVYECPGFATTGDMEVKNPLFNEEPTPATPGKCEVVEPQPKND